MRFKHIIFDYNGTITDDAEIGYEVCNTLIMHYSLKPISLRRFKETFQTPWVEFFVQNGVAREKIIIEEHQRIFRDEHQRLLPRAKLREDVVQTLGELKKKGYVLAVLSSRNSDDLFAELQAFGIHHYFACIVGEDHLHLDGTKAEKKVDEIISLLHINDVSTVLMVGDMVQDVGNARRHGFKAAVLTGGWQSEERLRNAKPDYLLHSFREILNHV